MSGLCSVFISEYTYGCKCYLEVIPYPIVAKVI